MKNGISKKKKVLSVIGNSIVLVAGNALYAFAVALFVMPSGLVLGGVTGISIFLEHFIPKDWPIDVSYIVFVINAGLFVLGAVVLGKKFAITTAASTVLYPMFLYIFQRVAEKGIDFKGFNNVHSDIMLCALVTGLLIGISIGAVARTGASTGGMDIPPLVINKLTGAPVGTTLLCFDVVVISMQLITSNINELLYGVIMIAVNSFVVNQVMVMGTEKIQISVISNNLEEVRAAILTEMHRGITLISSRKGLSGEPCEMVMSIISTRQLARAKKLILAADPDAFMIVTRVSEVSGNGFSFKKKSDKVLERSDIL
ncbi:MAG: YitT family protein [Ruminococcaceae bacterium]|nr:YitT family protein [Oscillospiraceae bacterium]